MSDYQTYEVEAADYNLAGTVRAKSAQLAAVLAANDITNNREATYDGDEYDIRVRPDGADEWTYWRVQATVRITFLATPIEAPEVDVWTADDLAAGAAEVPRLAALFQEATDGE